MRPPVVITMTARLPSVDPVIGVIKSKVLQDFIPQVPDIVTFIEKQYGFNTATARDFLQNRVSDVLTALTTPLLDERRRLQRKVDAQQAELTFAKDAYARGTANVTAVRNDLRDSERKTAAAVKESASLKAQNSAHVENLIALMRAFDLPTPTLSGKWSNAWKQLRRNVDALLKQRHEYETAKQQVRLLEAKLKEKTGQLNDSLRGEQKKYGEQIDRLTDELLLKRTELEAFKKEAENEISTLKQRVAEKDAQIEAFKKSRLDVQTRIEELTAMDADKQSSIERLNENVAEKQSHIDQLKEAKDNIESLLLAAVNENLKTVNDYTGQINALNEQINVLRAQLMESVRPNDRSVTCLAEFDTIKALYDRVSESLKTAQEYYVNYNDPVTKIILDVLAKVQANATDFSDIVIPKPKPQSKAKPSKTISRRHQPYGPYGTRSSTRLQQQTVNKKRPTNKASKATTVAAAEETPRATDHRNKRTLDETEPDDPTWTPQSRSKRTSSYESDKNAFAAIFNNATAAATATATTPRPSNAPFNSASATDQVSSFYGFTKDNLSRLPIDEIKILNFDALTSPPARSDLLEGSEDVLINTPDTDQEGSFCEYIIEPGSSFSEIDKLCAANETDNSVQG